MSIEFLGDQSRIPVSEEVFEANFCSQQNSTPAHGTIIRWGDDAAPMIEMAINLCDKALVATSRQRQYEQTPTRCCTQVPERH